MTNANLKADKQRTEQKSSLPINHYVQVHCLDPCMQLEQTLTGKQAAEHSVMSLLADKVTHVETTKISLIT